MAIYKYNLNDDNIKRSSIGMRAGKYDSTNSVSESYMESIIKTQNKVLDVFFIERSVQEDVEKGDWYSVFRKWAELRQYSCNVLASFLIYQANIDFLNNYDENTQKHFVDVFGLLCRKE